jgi:hypothetical protein
VVVEAVVARSVAPATGGVVARVGRAGDASTGLAGQGDDLPWPRLRDWIESLGGEAALAAFPALLELIQVVRNALAHHPRVVVQIAPIGPRDEGIGEWRSQLEQLIGQMTPELSLPSDPKLRQARRNAEARTQLLQELGALTGEQIGEEHSQAQNRHALAARWRKEGRIFGVSYRGQTLYPAFQFDAVSGGLKPSIRDVLAQLPRDRMSEWECALWWTAALARSSSTEGTRWPASARSGTRRARPSRPPEPPAQSLLPCAGQ